MTTTITNAVENTKTATRRTAHAAIFQATTLTLMFLVAFGGKLIDRAGGKNSDRGPSTLEYVFLAVLAVLVVGAAAAAGAIIVGKIMARANAIPE